MDEQEAIRIAMEYCGEQGRATDGYDVGSIRENDDGEVSVLFQGKSGRPGDHFTVWIDAATGEALRLVPGR